MLRALVRYDSDGQNGRQRSACRRTAPDQAEQTWKVRFVIAGDRTYDSEAERSIVYEVLARTEPLRRDELFDLLRPHFSEQRVAGALVSLEAAGVVVIASDTVDASEPAKRLDQLGLLHV